MKKAKLKKLLLKTKEAQRKGAQALKALSATAEGAKNQLERAKRDLKSARLAHKLARKHFRNAQKTLRARKADQKRADELLGKLQKKWKKLLKANKKSADAVSEKPLISSKKQKRNRAIKVVASEDFVAVS